MVKSKSRSRSRRRAAGSRAAGSAPSRAASASGGTAGPDGPRRGGPRVPSRRTTRGAQRENRTARLERGGRSLARALLSAALRRDASEPASAAAGRRRPSSAPRRRRFGDADGEGSGCRRRAAGCTADRGRVAALRSGPSFPAPEQAEALAVPPLRLTSRGPVDLRRYFFAGMSSLGLSAAGSACRARP